jgi:subtilase family serine protease
MTNKSSGLVIGLALFALFTVPAGAAERQILQGNVPEAVARLHLQSVGRVAATNRLNLAIGLPLRNREALTILLQQLYDPASTNYHKYLTSEQFTERFGPSEQDYRSLIAFAKTNGFTVTGIYPHRMMISVNAATADIERTFHVKMLTYRHPTEARDFYAPDSEPSLDLGTPVLHVSGMNNYQLAHPNNVVKQKTILAATTSAATGSGPSGNYIGQDFRNAYVPGVSLTGSGQIVGLLQFDGYTAADITYYEDHAVPTLPHVPLQNVLIDGFSGLPTGLPLNNPGEREVSLDIEMVVSMAPGLSSIVVYMATNSTAEWDNILARMVEDTNIKQFSCSWSGGSANPIAEQYFLTMQAQGQSFFNATGDSDAFTGAIPFPSDSTNITEVGATTLTMNGTGASYASETVWNWDTTGHPGVGSSGGISATYSIPSWQQGISMTASQGSTTMRNTPDVAMVGDNIYLRVDGSDILDEGGTSCAAPLWAGFTALVNQLAASQSLTSVGFLNPSLYAIGKGSSYNSCFNDITVGNNYWSNSQTKYQAVAGYDLCTGWGTPKGINLIVALMAYGSSVWVDFNYTGATSDGTYNFPLKTLTQGINAVPTGGNIWIRSAGSSPETMSITKPLTIRAFNGAATIGK